MSKAKEIAEGFGNLIFKTDEVEEISKYRLNICGTCEYRQNIKCSICGCFLSAKSRSKDSKCLKGKW